jgi:hypothetical protein
MMREAVTEILANEAMPDVSISLMPVRYWDLQSAMNGYEKTGVPLVAITQTDSGAAYRALGATDDAGLYYLLPKFAQLFHLSLADAWTLCFYGILATSLTVGVYGMMRFLKSPLAKIFFAVEIAVFTVILVKIGDVYALAPCLAIACAPFALRLIAEKNDVEKNAVERFDDKKFLWSVAAFVTAGIVFGIAHLVRSHSATGLVLFIITLLLFATRLVVTKRLVLIAMLTVGFALPQLYMKTVFDARDAFIREHQPNYNAALRQHPFWHSVYIGFGFLSNDYNIRYLDQCAEAKVKAVAPQAEFCSPAYEDALKTEVINLIKTDRWFVFFTVTAKLGVIGAYLIFFANIGLLAALRYPKSWRVELAFLAALSFNALFGILAMPRLAYLSGFLAFALLYGIVSLDAAITKRQGERAKAAL